MQSIYLRGTVSMQCLDLWISQLYAHRSLNSTLCLWMWRMLWTRIYFLCPACKAFQIHIKVFRWSRYICSWKCYMNPCGSSHEDRWISPLNLLSKLRNAALGWEWWNFGWSSTWCSISSGEPKRNDLCWRKYQNRQRNRSSLADRFADQVLRFRRR